jgi:dephospho-CoA kinase
MRKKKNNLLYHATALTGGIATGKSTVARFLTGLGARLIDTDLLAREIVEPGTPALKRISEAFGREYILPDGNLNREMMRDRIMKDPAKRDTLNSITHPAIMEKVKNLLEESGSKESVPVIIDVPLLFETGWDRYFNRIILVYTPPSLQIERLMRRDGIDRETAEITMKAQMPVDEKRARADFIIDNSGSREKTMNQVRRIFGELIAGKDKEGEK